jgi:hypothetical protein
MWSFAVQLRQTLFHINVMQTQKSRLAGGVS